MFRTRTILLILGTAALTIVLVVIGGNESGENSKTEGVVKRNLSSTLLNDPELRRIVESTDERVVEDLNTYVDKLDDTRRAEFFGDVSYLSMYMERNLLNSGSGFEDSQRRIKEALAQPDLYERNVPMTFPDGARTLSGADFFVHRFYPDQLKKLADLGLDLDRINPEVLRLLTGGEYSPEKQELRDMFGERINRTSDDFATINSAAPETPASIEKEAQLGVEMLKNKFELRGCFGTYEHDILTSDALKFCSETYLLFDKVYGKQKRDESVVTRSGVFALSTCALQINMKTRDNGSPFSSKLSSGSAVSSKKKLNQDKRNTKFAKAVEIDFETFFNFSSKICPGYIALYKKRKKVDREKIAKEFKGVDTVIFNITFDKFDCWTQARPIDCILKQENRGRLDSVFGGETTPQPESPLDTGP